MTCWQHYEVHEISLISGWTTIANFKSFSLSEENHTIRRLKIVARLCRNECPRLHTSRVRQSYFSLCRHILDNDSALLHPRHQFHNHDRYVNRRQNSLDPFSSCFIINILTYLTYVLYFCKWATPSHLSVASVVWALELFSVALYYSITGIADCFH